MYNKRGNEKMNNTISIVSQAFYGNRTGTEIAPEKLDRFILGYLDDYPTDYPIDRTIVKIPNEDNIVLVYNKYKEAERRKDKEKYFKKNEYILKPLATIPELNIEIYSRCIACRMNEYGEPESLQDGDYEKIVKYLAK